MVYFVIAGEPGCPNYAHAVIVSDYLERNLPNFNVKKVELINHEWSDWLNRINKHHKWSHRKSPLIYKALLNFGGIPHYIGGLSEFWEYCSDYYGLESLISPEELANFAQNNLQFYEKKRKQKEQLYHDTRHILIYGQDDDMTQMIVRELFEIEGLARGNGISIRFFDDGVYDSHQDGFYGLVEFAKNEYNARAKMITKLGMGMQRCEIIIITENFNLNQFDYKQIIIKMGYLADVINNCGKPSLRVIFASHGMSCFAATVLAQLCNLGSNIVVVASDLGLGPLNIAARKNDIELWKLSAPPVWGFLGHADYVDVGSALRKCSVCKPYARAIRSPEDTTLTEGTIYTELRFIGYLLSEEKVIQAEAVENRKHITSRLCRASSYSKVHATISLLKIWYPYKLTHTEIISLGVLSDGSYGIPKGLIFAQPATLVDDKWLPYANYPVPHHTQKKIKKAITSAEKILKMHYNDLEYRGAHLDSERGVSMAI